MKLNCLIVDDEPIARKVLEEYINDIDFLQLNATAENPKKAAAILEESKTDLLFLDIDMPVMNGIEFIRNSPNLPLVIITTAYTEYAIEGFELDVVDYLVKPFSSERFLKACTKAREYLTTKNNSIDHSISPTCDYFFVKCEGKIEKLFYKELIYVEAMMNYVVLHTDSRKMIVYLTIKGIEDQLPGDQFLKIHKSTIINTSKIRSIEGNMIDVGKSKLTISQNLHDSVLKHILNGKLIRR